MRRLAIAGCLFYLAIDPLRWGMTVLVLDFVLSLTVKVKHRKQLRLKGLDHFVLGFTFIYNIYIYRYHPHRYTSENKNLPKT